MKAAPAPCAHCSARLYASRLMLQGAGLRRRQVTRISIKGIIDVGTAASERGKTTRFRAVRGEGLSGSAAESRTRGFFPSDATFSFAVGVADFPSLPCSHIKTLGGKKKKKVLRRTGINIQSNLIWVASTWQPW